VCDKFMRPFSGRRPVLPAIFPAITQNITAQGNNAVGAFNRPVHARLFQTLTGNGSAPCLQYPRTYNKPLLPEGCIAHPFFIFLKITNLPFTYCLVVTG